MGGGEGAGGDTQRWEARGRALRAQEFPRHLRNKAKTELLPAPNAGNHSGLPLLILIPRAQPGWPGAPGAMQGACGAWLGWGQQVVSPPWPP